MRVSVVTTIAFLAGCAQQGAPAALDADMAARLTADEEPLAEGLSLELGAVRIHHEESGWVDIAEAVGTVDLGAIADEVATVAAGATVPSGRYNLIHLDVLDGWRTVDGVDETVEVPSGTVKIATFFCLDAGAVEALELLWDLEGNLHEQEGRLWLTPALKLGEGPTCGASEAAEGAEEAGGAAPTEVGPPA